jgi:hypothetical protein
VTSSAALSREDVVELAPLVRRAVDLDPAALVRVRRDGAHVSLLVRLPFGVLAARTVEADRDGVDVDVDVTLRGSDVLAWLDGSTDEPPQSRDALWRGGSPPRSGWQRVDRVPDADIRPLVRSGALTLKEAADREGVPGAQPREAVADALLDSVVLTVTGAGHTVEITLRTLSALTRLGFLPRDSHAAIDVAGRWVRVAAAYGSVYAERPGATLTVR